jgi:hypothetical protein
VPAQPPIFVNEFDNRVRIKRANYFIDLEPDEARELATVIVDYLCGEADLSYPAFLTGRKSN